MPSLSSAARRARAAADSNKAFPPPAAQAAGVGGKQAGGNFANQPASMPNPGPLHAGTGKRANSEIGSRDLAFEVRGYATDPKHSGYQILTNYESTYWRAFVGVSAWALYEVLRSFCHNGNNVCYPSINYLLEVLGIKQRRVLTGWSTMVKNKEYHYPGLIELLQNGGLVIAEMVGEGPMQRYLFHVNLTPDLLRPEQVAELPALLQGKHAEMLQAHFAEMAELASRRRPAKGEANSPANVAPAAAPQQANRDGSRAANSEGYSERYGERSEASLEANMGANHGEAEGEKSAPPRNIVQDDSDSANNIVENEGMTNCHTPLTNCHTPSDNLSHKQHQSNNTQLTSDDPTNLINNNSSGLQLELLPTADLQEKDVVVALTKLGLADSVVERLTTRFKRDRILEKIDFLAYLEAYQPNKVKNPRGWLRRAIEENYGPPDGYLPPAQRAAQQGGQQEIASTPQEGGQERGGRVSYAAFEDVEAVAVSQAAQATAQAERAYLKAARHDLVRRLAAPAADALAFWELVQRDVRSTMTADHYRLIAEASLLRMDEATVAVAIWERELYRELLHPNRAKGIERTMSMLIKRKLTLICEFWDEEGQVVPPGTPPP